MYGEQSVRPNLRRRIFRWTKSHVILIEVAARGICLCEAPEISVVMRAILGVSSVVLRDRLHRPLDRMAAGIFHRDVKFDQRRIRVETHGPHKLQPRLRVGWSGERNFAVPALRKSLKLEIAVV